MLLKKRIVSLLMVVAMVLQLLPAPALASDLGGDDGWSDGYSNDVRAVQSFVVVFADENGTVLPNASKIVAAGGTLAASDFPSLQEGYTWQFGDHTYNNDPITENTMIYAKPPVDATVVDQVTVAIKVDSRYLIQKTIPMYRYTALVDGNPGTCYGVKISDLPTDYAGIMIPTEKWRYTDGPNDLLNNYKNIDSGVAIEVDGATQTATMMRLVNSETEHLWLIPGVIEYSFHTVTFAWEKSPDDKDSMEIQTQVARNTSKITVPTLPEYQDWHYEWDTTVMANNEVGPIVSAQLFTAKLVEDSMGDLYSGVYFVADPVQDITFKHSRVKQGTALGDAIPAIPPERSGYYFDGWYTAREGAGEPVDANYVIGTEDDYIFYAKWVKTSIYHIYIEHYYIKYVNEVPIEEVTITEQRESVESHLLEQGSGMKSFALPNTYQGVKYDGQPVDILFTTQQSVDVSMQNGQIGWNAPGGWTALNATPNDEDGWDCHLRVEYVFANTRYFVSYQVKDLTGDGYTEIERVDRRATIGSRTEAEIKQITHYTYEQHQDIILEQQDQVVEVKYTRNPYTLSFNTGSGPYVDPVEVLYEGTHTLPTADDLDYLGYDFVGWYETPDFSGSPITTKQVTENTTVYAKWEPRTVEYTIIYMIENADDDGYSYLGSVTQTAVVDTTVTVTADQANQWKPEGLDATNFKFLDSNSALIKADGSSVVTVRYNRNRYTLRWNGELYETNGSLSASNQGTAEITAKYGQNIDQAFTAAFDSSDHCWNLNKVNNDKFVKLLTMPGEGDSFGRSGTILHYNNNVLTVYAFAYSTTKQQVLNYWLENYEGERTTTRNGVTYGLFKSVNVKFNYLYDDSDFYAIAGYTKNGYTATYPYGWGTRNYTLGNSTPNALLTANFYYRADPYPLTFNDYHGGQVETYQVRFNADITSYLNSAANRGTPPAQGATFEGWYTDPDHQTRYAGNNRMPSGMVLYANWILPTRTVTFHSQNDQPETIPAQTVVYNENATRPGQVPQKQYYTFIDWYTDPTGGSRFSFDHPITEDTDLYAQYRQNEIGYTVHYYKTGTMESVLEDKVVQSPSLLVGATITEEAPGIVLYRPDAARKSIELGFDNNVITFYYDSTEDPTDYVVHYVLREHPGVDVAAPLSNQAAPGVDTMIFNAADVDENYLETEIANSGLDAAEKARLTGELLKNNGKGFYAQIMEQEHVFTSGENHIYFYYDEYPSTLITITFTDAAGNAIAGQDPYSVRLRLGAMADPWTPPAIQGFTFKELHDESHAVIPANGTGVHLRYQISSGKVAGEIHYHAVYLKTLVVDANDKEKVYDGLPLFSQGVGDATVTGLSAGHTVSSINYSGSQTPAGASASQPSNAVILDASGNDVSNLYSVEYDGGVLKVMKAPVNIYVRGEVKTKEYDGTPLEVTYTRTYSGDGAAAFEQENWDDMVSVHTDGTVSQTDVGTKDLSLAGHFASKTSNYLLTFHTVNGSATVTPATLDVYSDGDEKVYDGTPLTAPGCRVVGLKNGETLPIKAIGTITNVGTAWNDVEFDWANATAKEDNYTFAWHNGQLKVTARPVTVSVQDKTAVWDGAKHYGYSNYTFDDILSGDDATITYTAAEGIQIGEYSGSYGDDFKVMDGDEDKTANYTLTDKKVGKLTITEASEKYRLDIRANSNVGNIYDGTEKAAVGYTVWYNGEKIGENTTGIGDTTLLVQVGDQTVRVTLDNVTASNPRSVNVIDTPNALTGTPRVMEDGVDVTDQMIFNMSNGRLKIDERAIEITANNASSPYTGATVRYDTAENNTSPYYTVTSETKLANSQRISAITITGEGVEADRYPIEITDGSVRISDVAGTDVTSNYRITLKPGTLTITQTNDPFEISLEGSEYVYDGTDKNINGAPQSTAKTGVTTFTFSFEQNGTYVDSLSSLKKKDVGEYTVYVKGTNPNYTQEATTSAVLKITQRPLTLDANNADNVYTGSEITYATAANAVAPYYKVTAGSLANNQSVSAITLSGARTEVGTADITIDPASVKISDNAGADVTANYAISVEKGTLTIRQTTRPIVISSPTHVWPYDGETHTDPAFAVSYNGEYVTGDNGRFTLPTGDVITITTTAAGVKDYNESYNQNNTYTYTLTKADGTTDASGNYSSVTANTGTLKISKKALTLTSGSFEREYNGVAVTNADVVGQNANGLIEETGWVSGEGATYTFTGSQTLVGQTANAFTIKLNEGTLLRNYQLKKTEGTLKVTDRTAPYALEVVANSTETVYDAFEHSAKGFVVKYNGTQVGANADGTGDTTITVEGVTYTLSGLTAGNPSSTNVTVTDAAPDGRPNAITGTAVVKDTSADANVVTSQFTVTTTDGSLKITKAPLTITVIDQEYTYNRQPRGEDNQTYTTGLGAKVKMVGWKGRDTLKSITLNGVETNAGKYLDKLVATDAMLGSSDQDNTANYDITYVPGKLTINPKALTITVIDQDYTYNGKPQGEDGSAAYTDAADITAKVTVTGLETGDELTGIKLTGQETNQGKYTDRIVASDAAIGADGAATGNYNITYVKGDLTINKLRLELTANNAINKYTGSEITYATAGDAVSPYYQVTDGSLAEGDAVSAITISGARQDVGTSPITIDPTSVVIKNSNGTGTDVTDNYIITVKPGQLTIIKDDHHIVITSSTKEWEYDSQPHTNQVYTVTYGTQTIPAIDGTNGREFELPTNDKIVITPFGDGKSGVKDFGNYSENNMFTYSLENEQGYVDREIVFGTLSIRKAPLTITVKPQTYTYNGGNQGEAGTAPYTDADTIAEKVTVTGLKGSDTLTSITLTGERKDQGVYNDALQAKDAEIGAATGNYDITYRTGTLTINKASLIITAKNQEYTYNAQPQGENNQTYTSAITEKVDVEGLQGSDQLTSITLNCQRTNARRYAGELQPSAAEVGAATDNYNIEYVSGDLNIKKAPLTVTVIDQSYPYNGKEQGEISKTYTSAITDKVTVEGLQGSDQLTSITLDGHEKLKGEYENKIKASNVTVGNVTANYDITRVAGKLTITQSDKAISIVSADGTWKYDGNEHSKPVYTVKYGDDTVTADATGLVFTLPTGDKLTISNAAKVKNYSDTGTKNNTFDYTLENADQYQAPSTAYGNLSITKRSVTLTSATATKEYDGTALEAKTVSVSGDGFAKNEGATYLVNGSQTEVGGEANNNIFTYTPKEANDATLEENYNITPVYGTLTVTANTKAVVFKSDSQTWKYDGEVHSKPVYTVTYDGRNVPAVEGSDGLKFALPTKDVITISNPTTVKNVADTDPAIASDNGKNKFDYNIYKADGTMAVANGTYTNVTATYGTLTITKRSVTLTSADDSKEYDGKPLTNDTVTVTGDGFVKSEGATYNVTGSQTKVGGTAKNNTFTYTLKTANDETLAGNYNITTVFGTLTVTKSTKAVEISSGDKDWTYDGAIHSHPVYTVKFDGEDVTAKDAAGLVFELSTGDTVTLSNARTVQSVLDTDNNTKNQYDYVLANADQYTTVTAAYGTLEIKPKALTLESDDLEKVYDGTALVNGGTLLKTENGWVSGEGATYTFTGSQTLVGQSPNSFTIQPKDGTDLHNYEVKQKAGNLTVTDVGMPDDRVVTKSDGSDRKYRVGETVVWVVDVKNVYDVVKTLKVSEPDGMVIVGHVPQTLAPGEEAHITVRHVVTAADVVATKITNTVTVKLGDKPFTGEDTVETEPIEIEITADSATKVYDGTALTKDSYQLTKGELAAGNTIDSVKVAGSQTLVGSSKNHPSDAKILDANGTDVTQGYTIEYIDGTLTVTDGTQPGDKDEVKDGLVVTKTAEQKEYKAGDLVTFTIEVTNIYDSEQDITLEEIAGVTLKDAKFAAVPGGEKRSTTAEYKITEEDILAGSFTNTVTAKLGKITKQATATVNTEAKNGHLTVTKTTKTETPVGGFKLGDSVQYEIKVINDGNLTIKDITVTDERTGLEEKVAVLAPGEEKRFETSTEVTEADILSGHVINDATADGTSPDPDKPDVPVDPGHTDDDPEDPKGHLTITKETTSKAKAEDGKYALGEEITYKITVTNDGNLTITGIEVKDELTGDSWKIASLAPNASEKFTAAYTVTEKDVLAGSVKNVATADGTSPDPKQPDVPVVPGEDEEPTEDPKGHLTITKETTSKAKAEDGKYALGEEITYKITVTNDGNLTITGIEVKDELTGDSWKIASLAPNASEEFTAAYTVTEKDVLAGSVKNVATADGISPDPKQPDVPVVPGEDEELTDKQKSFNLTINYLFSGGSKAAESYTAQLAAGDRYSVTSPTVNGYIPDQAVVAGVMPERDVQITVFYIPLIIIPEAIPVTPEPVRPSMPEAPMRLSNVGLNAGECIE